MAHMRVARKTASYLFAAGIAGGWGDCKSRSNQLHSEAFLGPLPTVIAKREQQSILLSNIGDSLAGEEAPIWACDCSLSVRYQMPGYDELQLTSPMLLWICRHGYPMCRISWIAVDPCFPCFLDGERPQREIRESLSPRWKDP